MSAKLETRGEQAAERSIASIKGDSYKAKCLRNVGGRGTK